ncbi:alpha/beta fold hydrolase [Sphingomonas sp.]|uniref:alpha/beta fold hydrolase n=1 Tax=Sphingomonas sp. TaxID=28214 RepID=UPI00286DE5BE|nr:alpha/beta fold hydrolase [Sphingomonas sp.]
MDVLDEILSSLRLNGGIVFDAEMHGDWCTVSQFSPEHCAPYFPVPEQIISYHYVRRGRMQVELPGVARGVLGKGAMVLFPRNDVHLLYSREGLEPQDLADVTQRSTSGEPSVIRDNGEGEETALYCGWLGVISGQHPLLEALPAMMIVEADSEQAGDFLASSLGYAAGELQNDAALVAKLSEVMFAKAVRRYVEALGPGEGGWLAGLRDPVVARALGIIHSRFADDLTIEALASEVGVSRTVLGERFAALLGEPPMRYCARWRMRTAANMLRDGKQNSANVAYAVGFNSEAAFNRAFKREYGAPPAAWRRREEASRRAAAALAAAPQLPPQQVRYAHAADGTRLAWSQVGAGPPLVKTANWLNHLEFDFESPIWRGWLRALAADFTLVRYDERGNGLSDWDTPELSMAAFVDDLACVVEEAELGQFDLLGISQGASVAIAYALQHPERVRRIVLLGGYAAGWRTRADNEEISRREAMLTLTELGWGRDNPAYRQLFTSFYVPGADAEQMRWFNQLQQKTASPENAVRLMREMARIDVRELLPQVRHPTLVLHARGDQAVPFGEGEAMARAIPGARFVPLDSDNHILLDREPAFALFLDELRAFLGTEATARAA